jgi:succinate dehydrogenase / fumarate reductase, membrane anchor subunit
MRYITDRKRAMGRGAAHSGTEHHWSMQVSSVGLALLMPVWVYIFGSALGQGHAEVVATFARPLPAILTALVLVTSKRARR